MCDENSTKCPICGNPRKHMYGNNYRVTCGNRECISKHGSIIKTGLTHTQETKDKLSKARKTFLKNNPDINSGRIRNTPSWPEKYFMKALQTNGGFNEFTIIREKSFYPYYADFAFENVKVVVEIDGNQHNEYARKLNDAKKDKLIQSMGWRVYRVSANKVLSNANDVLIELREFIGNINLAGYTSKIITDVEKKRKDKELTKKSKIEYYTKRNTTGIKERNKEKWKPFTQLIKDSDIEFGKFGGVQKAAKILNISPQKVNDGMKRNMNDFYMEHCFKKNSDNSQIERVFIYNEITGERLNIKKDELDDGLAKGGIKGTKLNMPKVRETRGIGHTGIYIYDPVELIGKRVTDIELNEYLDAGWCKGKLSSYKRKINSFNK